MIGGWEYKNIIIKMKSQRSLRSTTSHFKPKHSNSPTQGEKRFRLTSSYSQKGFWSRSFKNEPFPKQLKRRLVGRKFQFSDFSDQEQENSGIVVEEEEELTILNKGKVLPHVTIMSDRGEFYDSRSRIKSERKARRGHSRDKSVESLKLPQVMEEKKEEDELQRLGTARFSEVKDKNEFNQRTSKHSENISISEHSRGSHEPNLFSSTMPEEIAENEAEETKSEKLKRDNNKTILSSELEKIIVDEVDDKKLKKEESYEQISEIIEQERQEEETDNINHLRISLEKLEHQNQFLNKFMDEQLRVPASSRDNQSEETQENRAFNNTSGHVIKEE